MQVRYPHTNHQTLSKALIIANVIDADTATPAGKEIAA